MMRTVSLVFLTIAVSAQPINKQLAAEIAKIRAIDNHAHPVIPGGTDKEFDALPVDNLEASSDPVRLRPDSPDTPKAWRELFGQSTLDGMRSEEHTSELQSPC